jgi:hypothetical protein
MFDQKLVLPQTEGGNNQGHDSPRHEARFTRATASRTRIQAKNIAVARMSLALKAIICALPIQLIGVP